MLDTNKMLRNEFYDVTISNDKNPDNFVFQMKIEKHRKNNRA